MQSQILSLFALEVGQQLLHVVHVPHVKREGSCNDQYQQRKAEG